MKIFKTFRADICFTVAVLLCGIFSANAQIITTIAGNGGFGYSGDGGAATAATLKTPMAVMVDDSGNVLFSDHDNLVVRKISTAGIITTIAGNGTSGFSGDGGPATAASFDYPYALAKDDTGNLYIGDVYNNRIRKVNSAGVISTYWIARVSGMAIDHLGNIYGGQNYEVRKIIPGPFIVTAPFAGNGTSGFSGDGGPATAAQITAPWGVSRDVHGNIYIADQNNRRIRKVDSASNIITTVAGDGTVGSSGDGGPATSAEIAAPQQAVADAAGNIYIADWAYNVIRKVNPSGIISTIAGNGSAGFAGDGGPATAALFNGLFWIAIDCGNNLYLSDYGNRRIRKITQDRTPVFAAGNTLSFTICRDSVLDVSSSLTVADSDILQTEVWDTVTAPAHGTLSAHYVTSSTGGMITPSGIIYAPAPGFVGSDTFKIKVTDCGWAGDSISVYVTVSDTPVAGTISGPDTVCVGHSITLTDAASPGTWAASNTNAGITATGVVSGLFAGTDTASYTVRNVCGSATVTHIIRVVNCPNGTEHIDERRPVQLSPNPNNGMFNIFIPGNTGEPAGVRITDIMGRSVADLSAESNAETSISLQAKAGVYLLIISTSEGKYVVKMLVN
jgi:hypothetical protein